jgi:hypothetical protein
MFKIIQERENPCFVPGLSEKAFCISSLSRMLVVGLGICLLFWSFCFFFFQGKTLDFVNFFSVSMDMICNFFHSIVMMYYITIFILSHPCTLGINYMWSWCISLNYCFGLKLLMSYWGFWIHFHKGYCYAVSFSYGVSFWIW